MQKRRLLFEKCLIHLASLNLIKTAEGKAISLKQSSRRNWWIEFERLNIPIKIKTEKKGSASMMMNNGRLWKLDKQNVKKKRKTWLSFPSCLLSAHWCLSLSWVQHISSRALRDFSKEKGKSLHLFTRDKTCFPELSLAEINEMPV